MIEYFEFQALYRSIEPKLEDEDEKKLRKNFYEECDMIVSATDEKALSLDKFVYLAITNNYFRKELVDKFIKNVPKTVFHFFSRDIESVLKG